MKKKLIALNTTFMLGVGSIFAIPAVKAESISNLQNQKENIDGQRSGIQKNIQVADKEMVYLQEKQAQLNAQINRIGQAIKDNHSKIDETEVKIDDTQSDVEGLKKEVSILEDRIAKRNEVLKERALSFQESGGDVSYLEVLLGSSDFRDFVDRVGAVATIVEADRGILEQHEADKKELGTKKAAVEKKLRDLTDYKVELEGMMAQINEQKNQADGLKKELVNKEKLAAALKADLQEKDAGLASEEKALQQDMLAEEQRLADIKTAEERAAKIKAAASNESSQAVKSEEIPTMVASNTSTNSLDKSSNAGSNENSKKDSNASSKKSSNAGSNENSKKDSNASSKKSSNTTPKKTVKNTPAAVSHKGTGNKSVAISAGNKYIGNSVYVFGGGRTASDIANGRFDCSGFVAWAYSQAGISLPAHTDALKNAGSQISYSQIQPGDLVFFDTYKKDGHVGIYVGGGKFIGSQSSTGVAIVSMTNGYWKGVFNGRVVRI
ncbi:peptidase [Peribacillus cavernae]|uniref:Peptidase n=1 Tax=Peribacillus cavernae TaxID=1674310 RepID=A0A433HPE1_9BACI|nr:C40 family peptidase [Peribacillus cavernae]MDQ0217377.1 peptidoglycan hydrolase CwlO-like protein [Peribacillus cavernae]RUQ30173.1 peptidase [Peribacillus cavernae]